jgi:hypothetical protein
MSRQQLIDLYFLDARHKLIELGAFLDRVERAEGPEDFRLKAFRQAVQILTAPGADKARRLLEVFSDPTLEPIPAAAAKSACGAYPDSPP